MIESRLLMGPGPSDVHADVLAAMAQPTVGHLDPQFVAMMDRVKSNLRTVMCTENEMTMVISGPGSAGMECALMNVLEAGEHALICVNGVFGGRMVEVAQRIGAEVETLASPWGEAVDPVRVRSALQANPAKVVAFVHAETSTGVRSDAQAIAAVAAEFGALSVVDAVTSLGGIPLEIDAWGLDVVYSGSQKCLSAPPGLSPVSLSPRAMETVKNRATPPRSWLLDVELLTGYWGQGSRSYHHTAPVNAIYAMDKALQVVVDEGLAAVHARHRSAHQALAAGLAELDLTMPIPAPRRLPQLNVVEIPVGVDEAKIRSTLLNDFQIEIGAGLGQFAGKVWRLGLMGESARTAKVDRLVTALTAVLDKR